MAKSKWARWIGGGIGWGVGGPLGAIIGFALGRLVDNATSVGGQTFTAGGGSSASGNFTSNEDFNKAFVVLSAAVMKADGKVLKSELDYVKNFFVRNFGETDAKEYLLVLREVLKQSIDVQGVCEQIRQYMDTSLRLQILHYLFGIAKADGDVEQSELNVIRTIASYLGLSEREFLGVQAMFFGRSYSGSSSSGQSGSQYRSRQYSIKSYYTILEIDESATDDQLKKAYRKMAVKYHPDKLQHLEEAHQKAGKDKFLKVQEAYEAIKKSRGL
jgi:DnaJ like chaperone protein